MGKGNGICRYRFADHQAPTKRLYSELWTESREPRQKAKTPLTFRTRSSRPCNMTASADAEKTNRHHQTHVGPAARQSLHAHEQTRNHHPRAP